MFKGCMINTLLFKGCNVSIVIISRKHMLTANANFSVFRSLYLSFSLVSTNYIMPVIACREKVISVNH